MLEEQIIPELFHPYPNINFCGNNLHNVEFLFDNYGYKPIIVGIAPIPLIWIYNRPKKDDPGSQLLVSQSIAIHPNITVNYDYTRNHFTVIANVKGKEILILSLQAEKNQLTISEINLTPISYNIKGSEQGLYVGESLIKDNTFSDDSAFIVLVNTSEKVIENKNSK